MYSIYKLTLNVYKYNKWVMKWCDVMAYYAKHPIYSEITFIEIFDVKFSIWVFHFLFSLALYSSWEKKSLMNFLECTLWAVKPEKYALRKVFHWNDFEISKKELMLYYYNNSEGNKIRMEIILKRKVWFH